MVKFCPVSGYRLQTLSSFLFALIGAVLFHVSLQSDRSCAGILALFAGKRFLTSVGELVPLQSDSFYTLVVALIAGEGLPSTVGEHVRLEVISKCAGITALVTGEGLLSVVR